MAKNDRQSKEQLLALALAAFPASGDVLYTDWQQKLVSEGNSAAVPFYRELKKRGLVKATLTTNDDGSISHKIGRVN